METQGVSCPPSGCASSFLRVQYCAKCVQTYSFVCSHGGNMFFRFFGVSGDHIYPLFTRTDVHGKGLEVIPDIPKWGMARKNRTLSHSKKGGEEELFRRLPGEYFLHVCPDMLHRFLSLRHVVIEHLPAVEHPLPDLKPDHHTRPLRLLHKC